MRDLEVRKPADSPSTIEVDPDTFTNLADNLQAAWDSPDVTMRAPAIAPYHDCRHCR